MTGDTRSQARGLAAQDRSACSAVSRLRSWCLERARERRRALAAAEDRRQAGARRQLGAAIDRRHGEIELRPLGRGRSARPDRMEQRLALLPGPRLDLVRDRAEPLAIEPRRRRELVGQRARRRRARRRRSSRRATAASRQRRARRRSRTGTPAAPAPDRADRPTPTPSASPRPETRGPSRVRRHRARPPR